jgi:tRNA A37 threonylcarbamoyltransferase TsaD
MVTHFNCLQRTDVAMSSSGLNTQTFQIMTKQNRNNKTLIQHLTAITYSLCCTSVKKGFYVQK